MSAASMLLAKGKTDHSVHAWIHYFCCCLLSLPRLRHAIGTCALLPSWLHCSHCYRHTIKVRSEFYLQGFSLGWGASSTENKSCFSSGLCEGDWWNIGGSLARIFYNTGTILLWSTTLHSQQTLMSFLPWSAYGDTGAFTLLRCGQSCILLIICIWPSGFRAVPRVAIKILKPWNAQSFFYQAKALRVCLSHGICVICHLHPLD